MKTTYIEPDSDEELYLRLDQALAVLKPVYPDAYSATPRCIRLGDESDSPDITNSCGWFLETYRAGDCFDDLDLGAILRAISILNGQTP